MYEFQSNLKRFGKAVAILASLKNFFISSDDFFFMFSVISVFAGLRNASIIISSKFPVVVIVDDTKNSYLKYGTAYFKYLLVFFFCFPRKQKGSYTFL